MSHHHRHSPRLIQLCAWTLGIAMLGACGKQNASLPSTQVAAKVGSEEISLHQINTVLAQASSSGSTPEQIQVRSRIILEGLIDQQLALDQAIAAKLDRSPELMAQVEAARRDLLAGAYVKQFASSLAKPDAQEVRAYFSAHPALFAQRRIFNVQEIVTPRTPEVLALLDGMAAANKPLEEAATWLKSHNIPFTPSASSRAAEQIPLEFLPRMHALQDGQDATFTTANSITLLRLVGSRTAPIAEAAALPRIEQYLGNQRATEAVTAHMKALRDKTSVEYMGEFQKPAPTAAASAETALPAAAQNTPTTRSSTMDKGVAGLK